jgi:hypothetical protein
MTLIHAAYLHHQLKRLMRHDSQRFLRPDWRRFTCSGQENQLFYQLYDRIDHATPVVLQTQERLWKTS